MSALLEMIRAHGFGCAPRGDRLIVVESVYTRDGVAQVEREEIRATLPAVLAWLGY